VSRKDLRESIYRAVEYFTKNPLSDQGKRLVIHYFNQSMAANSRLKAQEAIERYTQKIIPPSESRSRELENLLDEIASEAYDWDREQ